MIYELTFSSRLFFFLSFVRDRILSGRLLPSALATMSSKELASSEMAQERERIRQLAVKNVRQTHT